MVALGMELLNLLNIQLDLVDLMDIIDDFIGDVLDGFFVTFHFHINFDSRTKKYCMHSLHISITYIALCFSLLIFTFIIEIKLLFGKCEPVFTQSKLATTEVFYLYPAQTI